MVQVISSLPHLFLILEKNVGKTFYSVIEYVGLGLDKVISRYFDASVVFNLSSKDMKYCGCLRTTNE